MTIIHNHLSMASNPYIKLKFETTSSATHWRASVDYRSFLSVVDIVHVMFLICKARLMVSLMSQGYTDVRMFR